MKSKRIVIIYHKFRVVQDVDVYIFQQWRIWFPFWTCIFVNRDFDTMQKFIEQHGKPKKIFESE